MTSDDSFSNLENRAKRGFGGFWHPLFARRAGDSGAGPGGYLVRCFGASVGGDENFTPSPANFCKCLIEHQKLDRFLTVERHIFRIPVCVTGPRQAPNPGKARSAPERERTTRQRNHRPNPRASTNKMSKNGKPGSKKSAFC